MNLFTICSRFSPCHIKIMKKLSRDGEYKKFFVCFQMEKIEIFMHEKRTWVKTRTIIMAKKCFIFVLWSWKYFHSIEARWTFLLLEWKNGKCTKIFVFDKWQKLSQQQKRDKEHVFKSITLGRVRELWLGKKACATFPHHCQRQRSNIKLMFLIKNPFERWLIGWRLFLNSQKKQLLLHIFSCRQKIEKCPQ